MSKLHNLSIGHGSNKLNYLFSCVFTLLLFTNYLIGQCTTSTGVISGKIFKDQNLNGILEASEGGVPFVQINAYDSDSRLAASAISNLDGTYSLTSLQDAKKYRIEVIKPSVFEYTFIGDNNKGEIRFINSPSCSIHFGFYQPNEVNLNPNPDIAVSIFNSTNRLSSGIELNSILSLKQKFTSASAFTKLSTNSETGSIYGLAWNKSKSILYASAFVKQYGPMGPLGLGGIYTIDKLGTVGTFVNLNLLGINLGSTNGIESENCELGAYVGKTGLGNLDISDDDQFVLVTNLFKKSLLIIPTNNPTSSNIVEISIPNPGCSNGDYVVAAVKYYNGFVYLGVTCTGETDKSNMSFHIYEYNLLSRVFNEILSTNYAKNYWITNPGESKLTSQWLTDIDFNNRGEMILGIADRKGHTYCAEYEPLTNQEGDILVAFKSGNKWYLENGGIVNGRAGSGVGRYEGPGNGEFFGEDYWIVGPSLHPEVSFGTIAAARDAEVVSAVFDPRYESFAGGLHRYNTDNGKLISTIELYNRDNNQFGKASGIGDIEVLNEAIPIEVGNYLWLDQDKDGIQDPNESGIEGVKISLYNKNCKRVASVITDVNGNYLFDDKNVDLNLDGIMDGLQFGETYYIAIDDSRFNSTTGRITINNIELELTSVNMQTNGLLDSYDSDAIIQSNLCLPLQKFPVVTVVTGNSGQNQFNFDIGLKPYSIIIDPPKPQPIYDLALIKKINSTSNLKLNDYIDFVIEVYNQGDAVIDQFEIIDYVPEQFEFVSAQNLGWKSEGTNAIYTSTLAIAPGQKQNINIKLKLVNILQVQNIINVAEISSMKDVAGNLLKDKDSTPDKIKNNDAGGVVNSIYDNSVNGNGIDDEDDQDPANLQIYDVALILTSENQNPAKINEDRRFQVRVCNQGSESIKNTKFIQYLPNSLTLSPSDNNGWMLQNGKLYNIVNQELFPGQCATKDIVLRISNYNSGPCIEIRSEIVSFENQNGVNVTASDIDSKADEILGNDAGGVVGTTTDNVLTGNGINDEDDEDPEIVRIADLALIKRVRNGTVLKYQGNVIFDITLYNQGCLSLKNITIIDYLPKGFQLSSTAINNGWSILNDKLYFVHSALIIPGGSATIPIELTNIGDVDLSGIINRAEIVAFADESNNTISIYDYDSTPDTDQTNDKGAQSGGITDDMINDHGLIDEDDHDIAVIPIVDLALTKTLVNPNILVKEGSKVEFKIKIYNQGNQSVHRVVISDYISSAFTFNALDNPGWQLDNALRASYILNQTLAPGATKEFSILLDIRPGTSGTQIPNCAEISSIQDEQGLELIDYDSQQDLNKDNDKYSDSRIDDHGLIDEDDHDKAITNPLNFDLLLRKFVNKRVVEIKGEVEWTIDIINQGSIAATEIELVDYLPEDLSIIDPQWEHKFTENGIEKYYQILSIDNGKIPSTGLLPGETLKVKVVTIVNENAKPGLIVNGAEIVFAKNIFNEPDSDSDPDDDDQNDPGGNVFDGTDGTIASAPGDADDEDDSDIEGVFYLVLENEACNCLDNASNPGNGQFSVDLSVESRNDEVWHIKSVNGLFDPSSASPPALPTPFAIGPSGFTLTPIAFTGLTTVYGMTGIFISGIGFDIILQNQYGDKVSLGNVRCNYEKPKLLESQNNVCNGSTIRYTVESHPGSTYQWTLSSGGTIVSEPTKNSVLVQFLAGANTTHTLTVIEKSEGKCIEPLELPVTIGVISGSISCIGNAQVSLNNKCEATITAHQLLVGGPYDYNSYAVMIINKDGSLVPNNIVTYEHVAKSPLKAKVINTCNGNACWTWITVEDKLAPILTCINDTIDCTRMKSHLGPLVYDNCDLNPTKTLIKETIENTPCNPLYSKIIHRQYQAKDASGNLSKVCNSDYFLKRIVLDSVEFPDSLNLAKNNHLSCSNYPKDSLGRPDPYYTGRPKYNGHPIWPNSDVKYCDFVSSFEDIIVSNDNCVRKINRVWKLTIWYCSTFEQRTYIQRIEIRDNEAPEIHCPYDKEIFAGSGNCSANVYISPIDAIDQCNNGVNITLEYAGGIVRNFVGGFIELPVGKNIINVTASDNCYNRSYCSFIVNVIDKTAPIAQCDRESVVSLDRFGYAWVPASVFNDGSYDNCHLKLMKARRMDTGLLCSFNTTSFADSIGFCCADIGQLVTVLFQVTDESGNSNTCMVRVEVQDKTVPKISCPHDVTINCEHHYNVSNLSEFGDATVSDNCNVSVREVDSVNINQCREGYIERIFMAGNDFGLDVCTQKISIINDKPFEEKDIIWPPNLDTAVCNVDLLNADRLNEIYRPSFIEDRCDLVGISHEDHVFRFVTASDACFKILRKWKIINWCRFKDSRTGEPIIYEHIQILKAHNKVAPRILEGCTPSIAVTSDTSCFGGNIFLTSIAEDDCTLDEELLNRYEIDLDADGIIDFSSNNVGSRIDASGYYKLGLHSVKYIFEDKCGNKSVCETTFEIINKKLPSAYCKKGLAVGIEAMDLNGDGKIDGEFATVWAKDLDQGSSHPCGYDITLSIGRDSSKHSITYDCKNVGRNIVLLCATSSNGTQDCCETFIDVQDNNNQDYCGCVRQPSNVTVNSCIQLTDPISINSSPQLVACTCDSNRVTFTDTTFNNILGLCRRIERRWKVEFFCANERDVFNFSQFIDVTTNLREADIQWPEDTLLIDDCVGSIDTSVIGGTPHACLYGGNVMIMFSDEELPRGTNTRVVRRRWNVFSKCVLTQSFFYDQIIIVRNGLGSRITIPADLTINNCRTPFLPDSLNGYPSVSCGCDTTMITYKDDTLKNNNEVCYIVERNWSVKVQCRPRLDSTFTGVQRIIRDVDLVLTDIIWPVDTFRSFTCAINTSPNRTGRPTLKSDFCNLVTITFSDSPVTSATCNTVRRTWTVRNTCSNTQVFTRDQIIIHFNQGTIGITCPPNLTVNADPNLCGAIVTLNTPGVSSPCNFGVSVTNNAPATFPVGVTNVIFTARDTCNHIATCTTTVTVIENIPPVIRCPRDTIVECSANLNNLSNFGTATATDNCPGVILKDSVIRNLNVCGIGNIIRFFIATDASGNRATCNQTITVHNTDPLDSLEINWPLSPFNVSECESTAPSNTGMPTVAQGSATCFKLSVTFKDTSFCTPGNCQINRKWTVLDSCTNTMFMYIQQIKINDTIPPTIAGIQDTMIFANDSTCSGFLNIKAFVTNCDSAKITITNNSQFGGNGMNDASGVYPEGTTQVKFTATDGCCNMSMKTISITVKDTIPPTILCKKVHRQIADNGCAVIHANEFVVNLNDNCTPDNMLTVSFSPTNLNDTIRNICCDSLGANHEYFKTIVVYVVDKSGNIGFCETLLRVTDPSRFCGNLTQVNVSGFITTRKDKKMTNVPVDLMSQNIVNEKTDNSGIYAFKDMPLGGKYNIVPSLDIDPLDGVSTFDIVLIQSHILGKRFFTDPFQHIAADINNSKSVTAADISELRKLILGINEKFSNNSSWKFISSEFVFSDPNHPLDDVIPNQFSIPSLQDNVFVSFKGIKIGDVDDSQKYSGFNVTKSRTNGIVPMTVESVSFRKGEIKEILISFEQYNNYLGAQGTLEVDPRLAKVIELVVEESSSIRIEHLGTQYIDRGLIKFSWIPSGNSSNWHLRVKVQALTNVTSEELIGISENHLVSEAYNMNGEVQKIVLRQSSEEINVNSEIILYQNIPNPFSENTLIPIESKLSCKKNLSIYDFTGKMLGTKSIDLVKGLNYIEIDRQWLNVDGVYLYKIEDGTNTLVRKMIVRN